VDALASLFETAGLYGRTEELAEEMAVVQNLMLSTMYLRFPTGVLPTPSDTKGQLYAPDEELLAKLYRLFPTKLGVERAQEDCNWNTLLDPPQEITLPAKTINLPPVTSRNFETSRMAVLKEGPWQVFFHYGQPPIKSHLQAEVLNFSAYYNNIDVTHDPGTVGYGSPLHRNYYLHGLNHNVPLVNGEGQEQPPKGRKPDPFVKTRAGELLEFAVDPPRVAAAHPVYRRDAKAARTLSIEGNKLIDSVEIETSTKAPRQLGLSLHLQGRVKLPDVFAKDDAFDKDRPKPFSYWTDVRTATYRDQATFDVEYQDAIMKVTIAAPDQFRIWHGSTPDSPPNRREGFYVETEGVSATFTTIFEPVVTEAKSQ
jgi:hypothetical protein